MLSGAIAASVTPLRGGGSDPDEEAIGPLVRFLSGGGVDGAFVCGTTGEGVLLTVDERRRVAEGFVRARPEGFAIAVHAGAQSTADTVALATHAKEIGADAVAVIAPPYFPLDDAALFEHLRSAAEACGGLPFYVYEFEARSGYPVPVRLVERLREAAPNLAGMKVSDTPWSAVEPYRLDGLDLFVGNEPLVLEGLEHGADGTVSGLAAGFPEIVASLGHHRDPVAGERVRSLRTALGTLPFHAALKEVLVARGVPIRTDVRPPLRALTPDEREVALGAARAAGAL